MVAHNPLHRSGRAAFPHPAFALGDDAHAAQWIVMAEGNGRQPAFTLVPFAGVYLRLFSIPERPASRLKRES